MANPRQRGVFPPPASAPCARYAGRCDPRFAANEAAWGPGRLGEWRILTAAEPPLVEVPLAWIGRRTRRRAARREHSSSSVPWVWFVKSDRTCETQTHAGTS